MSSDANPVLGSSFSSRPAHFSPSDNQDPEPPPHRPGNAAPPLFGGRDAAPLAARAASAVALIGPFGLATAEEAVDETQGDGVGSLLQRGQEQLRHFLSDQVTPLRLAGHLAVLTVGAAILILSQVKLPEWNFTLSALPNNALGGVNTAANPAPISLPQQSAASEAVTDMLQRTAIPFTAVQEKPRAVIENYTVKAGDTVLAIAARFGLQPETIMWANSSIEQNPDRLAIGDLLNILPFDGVLHIVKPGDTLSGLAAKYKVDASAIIGYSENQLADASAALTIGSQIVVPGGTKPFITPQINTPVMRVDAPADAAKGSGSFSWPTSGNVTQQFWGGHRAIDIGSWVGAPVKSADSGYVVEAGGGWNGGYGNHVLVDHGNGFATLYAHLNSIFVRPGESISRGQQIGTVGMTGNSTGPHLHFEIRYQGSPRNPFNWLP
jgi:murein DD-endopeptidase MepM/ murein hydrolase activator NlpD